MEVFSAIHTRASVRSLMPSATLTSSANGSYSSTKPRLDRPAYDI
jgi:hypothetical protein